MKLTKLISLIEIKRETIGNIIGCEITNISPGIDDGSNMIQGNIIIDAGVGDIPWSKDVYDDVTIYFEDSIYFNDKYGDILGDIDDSDDFPEEVIQMTKLECDLYIGQFKKIDPNAKIVVGEYDNISHISIPYEHFKKLLVK